jgi:hypothetical protein
MNGHAGIEVVPKTIEEMKGKVLGKTKWSQIEVLLSLYMNTLLLLNVSELTT